MITAVRMLPDKKNQYYTIRRSFKAFKKTYYIFDGETSLAIGKGGYNYYWGILGAVFYGLLGIYLYSVKIIGNEVIQIYNIGVIVVIILLLGIFFLKFRRLNELSIKTLNDTSLANIQSNSENIHWKITDLREKTVSKIMLPKLLRNGEEQGRIETHSGYYNIKAILLPKSRTFLKDEKIFEVHDANQTLCFSVRKSRRTFNLQIYGNISPYLAIYITFCLIEGFW